MDKLIQELRATLGPDAVLSEPHELLVYECDGLPHHKYLPRAVVFPTSTEETAQVMRVLARAKVPFTPRGAGTGLSGGALALDRGVVIELARMRKVLKIDEVNRLAVVQTGVVNSHVSRAVAYLGLHYVPDPSSQPTCTIGGNIAENAGGIHCLKYGTTTDHVLGARVVLAGGEVVDLGGHGVEARGYDLLGVFIGSEGTFGIATEATLRLVPLPPAVRTLLAEFDEVNNASHAVSAIIAAGVMPAALEMMDKEIIRAVEASVFAAGLLLDVGAALLIELDGVEAGLDEEADRVKEICLQYGARYCRSAVDENERKKLWAARKGAFGAIGRIAPDSMIQDAVVPRSRLPEVLADAYRISAKYQLRLANVFHAGDGNLHPLICFDSRSPDEVRRVKEAGRELMETCVRAGGSITGEHGVGFDKRELLPLIFSEADMETMLRVRAAFDPLGFCNPGKIIPMLRGCGEARAVALPNTPASNTESALLSGRPIQTRTVVLTSRVAFDPDVARQKLGSVVGDVNVSSPSLTGLESSLLVTPDSIDQVCATLKLAAAERWSVVPGGAGTWLTPGASNGNIIVSTRRLNHLIEHEPADLVAFAEAGLSFHDLNELLASNGQWLPLDPPGDQKATIGGVVATGLGGAQQFGYGPPRRHVIGMKVVLSDGTLVKLGGRVVKNVAGYDLSKLFTGSYGTLGVIVEVNFKLRPLPFATATIGASGSIESLVSAAQSILGARLFPVAIELLSPAIAHDLGLGEPGTHTLLVKFDGAAGAVAEQSRSAMNLMGESAGMVSVDTGKKPWQAIANLSIGFNEDLVFRVSVLPGSTGTFLGEFEGIAHANPEAKIFWQAGLGDGRVRIMVRSNSPEEAIGIFEALETKSQSLRGTFELENAPAGILDRLSIRPYSGPAFGVMQKIKHQLDPGEVFSSNRFKFLGDSRTAASASEVAV